MKPARQFCLFALAIMLWGAVWYGAILMGGELCR
jgi:hypothetical protein